MKAKATDRPVKRAVIVELTETQWRQFLKLVRRHGYRFVDDPEGVMADLPRPVAPNVPSQN